MRTGILSDEYVKKKYPAFFKQNFRGKSIIPYYDLYQIAQVTMDNPYRGASDIVERYTNNIANQSVVTPDSPVTIFESIGQGMTIQELFEMYMNIDDEDEAAHKAYSPQLVFPDSPDSFGKLLEDPFGLDQFGTNLQPENPPRTLPNLRPNFGYNPQNKNVSLH